MLAMTHRTPDMTARLVMIAARAALLATTLALCAFAVSPVATVEALVGPIGGIEHFIAFYALMTLAVMAFPRGRRNDIGVTLVVFAAMIEVLRESMGASQDLSKVFVDASGVLAVYGPTHLETLRQNMRTFPAGAPFARQFVERRRPRSRSAASTRAAL